MDRIGSYHIMDYQNTNPYPYLLGSDSDWIISDPTKICTMYVLFCKHIKNKEINIIVKLKNNKISILIRQRNLF